MTPIEKLEKLLAEATPGLWETNFDGLAEKNNLAHFIESADGELIVYGQIKPEDAALIVELRNNAEALLAALRTQGEQGWQDIATAPKDHKAIWLGAEGVRQIGLWAEGAEHEHHGSVGGGWKNADKFYSYPYGRSDLTFIPTHWMPLPTPPVLES